MSTEARRSTKLPPLGVRLGVDVEEVQAPRGTV